MQVLKFGGTSVANAGNINKTVEIILQAVQKDKTIAVVSALGGTTDVLIEAGNLAAAHNDSYKEKLLSSEQRHLQVIRELLPVAIQSAPLSMVKRKFNELESICEAIFLLEELSLRSLDNIVSYGELLSSLIISSKFESLQIQHQWIDARQLIRTNSNAGFAAVNHNLTQHAISELILNQPQQLFVVPGFIGSDEKGITTTLGRGGSDYTAAIIAAELTASVLEIWTDVSGMMTADPRIVSNAKAIPYISYQEAMELSHFGAKVIYPPTIQPVMKKGIPVWIKNTFAPGDYGTLIETKVKENKNIVRGISSIAKMALLSLEGSGMIGIPGFSKRLFGALANEKINVILITQSSSEHSICVAIDEANAGGAKEVVDAEFSSEIAAGKVEPLLVETGLAIIALIGDNMKNHQGVSGKMFTALGRNGINIRAIAQGSSEKNISAVIATADVKKGLNVLHEGFFETAFRQINLFIVGIGNVGSRLMAQLEQQQKYLQEQLRLQVRVIGIANSRQMLLSEDGIDLKRWQQQLENGVTTDLSEFTDFATAKNLRNTVFVDVTSSEQLTACYKDLLKKSIAVVACNKVACSSAFENYSQLKELAREFNAAFLFETNVGASLPVIGTLNDLVRSGDKVNKIQAALSGTLNYVFNHYDGTALFAGIVKQAQDEGYTEPDPRIDLSGTDVMRKILILAREAGYVMEMDEIENNSFLPESCMEGDVEHFYKELEKHESHFKSLFDKAAKQECKLKFVAALENGKASVGLQYIDKTHDLYQLYGKDNVVLFYTTRYSDQPLVIKGAGAGADVTASGIFADIMRAARI